jgi:site-specific DNA-methyltransferase (adenine-specific)
MIDLRLGDCLEILQTLKDNSVDSVVCDPPYHLTSTKGGNKGFMGKEWDGGDIAFRTDVWKECLRVLKPGGYLLAFSSSRTYHRIAVAIEDAGFDIRDQIMWIYGQGFPKSHNIGKAIDAKIKTGKSNPKSINQSEMSKTNGNVVSVIQPNNGILGEKRKVIKNVGASLETDDAKNWEGWGTALKPAHEPIVMARKPLSEKSVAENVMKWGTGGINIDESRIEYKDGIENEFSETYLKSGHSKSKGEDLIFNISGNKREGVYVNQEGRFPANIMFDDDGDEDWKRYFYCAKASKKEKGVGNIHPTIKPLALMEYLIRMTTKPGGVVLDCFMGSGSTGVAAKRNGFGFIGVEKEQEYFDIAKQRIDYENSKIGESI